MKNYCKKCGKRDTCIKLCKEAEEYVNQDYIEREEQLANFNIENLEEKIDPDDFDPFDDDLSSRILKSRHKYTVILLHQDGKSADEISYYVPYSLSQIYRIIQKYKKS